MEDGCRKTCVDVGNGVEKIHKIPDIDAGLAASVFHFGEIQIPNLKTTLKENGITVRL